MRGQSSQNPVLLSDGVRQVGMVQKNPRQKWLKPLLVLQPALGYM